MSFAEFVGILAVIALMAFGMAFLVGKTAEGMNQSFRRFFFMALHSPMQAQREIYKLQKHPVYVSKACGECGTTLGAADRFCSGCGISAQDDTEPSTSS